MTVCGTGTWTGPLPGDPSTDSVLSAAPAFGGIDVSWTYPATNPYAVAHTLLYRGVNATFANAVLRSVVAGNTFYDKMDSGSTYYYWIQIVSINGTTGATIGPASATAKPLIVDMLTQLTAKIDASKLATSLNTQLNQISTLNTNLAAEIVNRENGQTTFATALADVEAGIAAANTFITTVNNSRVSGDAALAEQITLVAATLDSDIAAVSIAANAWVTPMTTAEGKITDIGALYTAKVTVNGLVGGFGIYNTGATVDAGFDVDTFWVGRTGANKRKPFIIVDDVTYIDQAVIQKLTFSKLTDEAGTFIVADGQVKADYLDTKGLAIKDALGNVIFSAGTALASGNTAFGISANVVPNADFIDGATFALGTYTTATAPEIGINFASYQVIGEGTGWVRFVPTPTTGQVMRADIKNGTDAFFAVTAGQKYEFSAFLNALRCTGTIYVTWYNSAETGLSTSEGNAITHTEAISSIANMRRSFVIATAPTGAVKAKISIRGVLGTEANAYLFFSRAFMGLAGSAQTEASPWSPGRGIGKINSGNASTYIADLAVNTLQIAGNAITHSKFASGTYNCGYGGGTTLTGTFQTVLSTTVTVSGVPSGAVAGTIVQAHVVVYVSSGSDAIIGEILVNGSSAGAIAAPPGYPMTIAGFTELGNGTHTILVQLKTAGGSVDIQGNCQVTVMSGKR